MKEYLPDIVAALMPLLIAALGWLSIKLAALISAKVKNESLKGVLVRLDNAVYAAVKDVSQTYADAIKEASKDGKLTAEEAAEAKDRAIAKAKSYLGKPGLDALMVVLGLTGTQADSFLAAKVESAVRDTKPEPAPVP